MSDLQEDIAQLKVDVAVIRTHLDNHITTISQRLGEVVARLDAADTRAQQRAWTMLGWLVTAILALAEVAIRLR